MQCGDAAGAEILGMALTNHEHAVGVRLVWLSSTCCREMNCGRCVINFSLHIVHKICFYSLRNQIAEAMQDAWLRFRHLEGMLRLAQIPKHHAMDHAIWRLVP